MDELKFYLSIFMRRLPYFLVVATIVSAISFAVALSLPPAYESQMRLVVEAPQIPEDLARSTVRTPALEQLQIIEQRLMTRANMLDIARRLDVLPQADEMSPDDIVRAMRSRTAISTTSGRSAATMMTVSFEAGQARKAADVMNEYLNIIQATDAEFRRGRAGETLEFFAQEVSRLGDELSENSARIVAFKQENTDALPESLDFRLSKRSELRERMVIAERDVSRLKGQRDRLVELYETTGRTDLETLQSPPSQSELQLQQLETELSQALLIFSEENPKVKLLRGRINILQAEIDESRAVPISSTANADSTAAPNLIDIEIGEVDVEIALLQEQTAALADEVATITATIERTPEVSVTLEEMERNYALIQNQYRAAEERLARAQTGDLIESRSRGQRVAVIEQPNVPNSPTKPNRVLIAGGGTAFGITLGIGLVVLIELMKSSIRRPEDLVSRFGISPFTTVPYIRTQQQVFVQRGIKLLMVLSIVIGIPALIYAMHIYYLPVDLVAEKVMNRLGVRW